MRFKINGILLCIGSTSGLMPRSLSRNSEGGKSPGGEKRARGGSTTGGTSTPHATLIQDETAGEGAVS